jgi:CheY-like chemotaxis protein
MHGGTMWLESQLGIGTTFHFTLPLQRTRSLADPQTSSKRWFTPYHQVEVDYHPSKAPKPVVLPQYVLLDHGSGLDRLFNRNLDDVEVKNTNSLDDATQILSRSPSQGLIINRATVDIPWREIFKNMVIPYETPVMYCWITGEDETASQLGVVDYLLKPVLRDQLLESINKIGKEIHTILLVDDEIEILQLFARILNSADRGYVVLRAKNGDQALEIMRERHPDVVLMDLVMPELDGFQVIRKKNKDDSIRDIPVIIISSKDPTGAPILSDHLTITRKNGFSSRELLSCIKAVSEILAPEAPSNGRVRKLSVPV